MGIVIRNTNQGGRITFRSLGLGGHITSGWPVVSPSVLLLDTYPGAAAAYSLRKLSSTYNGSAIRVRRSSDNAETDIGFVNNELDTVSLNTFVGANSGFITTWYDQSGNVNNATQTIANNQNQIVNSGTIYTQNDKPAIFSTSAGYFDLTSTISSNSSYSQFAVMTRQTRQFTIAVKTSSVPLGTVHYSDGTVYFGNRTTNGSYANNTTGRFLYTTLSITNIFSAFLNSISKTITTSATTATSDYNVIGARVGIGEYSNGYHQEILIYLNDQSANRTAIETNINSYYSIY